MIMNTNYVLSTNNWGIEIIPSTTYKEPIVLRGKTDKSQNSGEVVSTLNQLLNICYRVSTLVSTGDKRGRQMKHHS